MRKLIGMIKPKPEETKQQFALRAWEILKSKQAEELSNKKVPRKPKPIDSAY